MGVPNVIGVNMIEVMAWQVNEDSGQPGKCEITFYMENGREVFMHGVSRSLISNFLEEWQGHLFQEG